MTQWEFWFLVGMLSASTWHRCMLWAINEKIRWLSRVAYALTGITMQLGIAYLVAWAVTP